MTRVAFVAHDGLSTLNFARWFAQELRRRDDVVLHTISSRDLYAEELAALGTRHIDIGPGRFVEPLRDLAYFWALYRTFARERFDVVVTFGTKPNIYGPPAARLAGIRRVVLAVRGLGRLFNPPAGARSRALSWFVHRLYRAACGAADRVWFTSAHDRDYMIAARLVDPDRTFLTANSVDPAFFSAEQAAASDLGALRAELGFAPGDLVVIMVARLVWLKGIAEFVEAAAILRAARPDVRFLLVAPREDGASDAVPVEYVARAQQAGRIAWVEFRKDVRALYQLADIAVLPSYYKEGGYPRALLEPMALGKPVIAADTPECRGPVEPGRNGFLVPPRDAAALAARIAQLVEQPDLRRRFGLRSREIVLERFADAIVGRQVLAELGVAAA
ncbi:MAG: glycosyltransferase family 4 protein [Acidobacteria bacterium]|nr:glycosyltransferase family 4 protein [Acidobacteriota bacterium]